LPFFPIIEFGGMKRPARIKRISVALAREISLLGFWCGHVVVLSFYMCEGIINLKPEQVNKKRPERSGPPE